MTDDARKLAAEAAARSGVRIELARELDTLQAACNVIESIWRSPPDDPPMTPGLLRALTHAGNYCALAWDGVEPIGVCVGFLGADPAHVLHSHIAGVTASAAGRHVGRALKLDQRAWALEHGIDAINWTFDPLVRRNAYFNAARLGALPTRYLVDFYGEMSDAINLGHPSDRLDVLWRLDDPHVVDICAGRARAGSLEALVADGASVVLADDHDLPIRAYPETATLVRLVQVPRDIESMRADAPDLARQWRLEVRSALGSLLNEGWHVTDVLRSGHYVLRRDVIGDHLERRAG